MNRIEELEKKIESANKAYWDLNNPEISDYEYDSLVEELKSLDPENKLIFEVRSQDIQGDKIVHKKPMLSLSKVYSKEDLLKWVSSKARNDDEIFLIQPKYDGISGKFEDGVLSTRGNGKEGTNITSRLPIVKFETDKRENKNGSIDFILGEILIKNSDFKNEFSRFISKSGKAFKNQRNGVAGIMGCDDVSFYESQGLKVTLVDYDKNSFEISAKDFPEKWEEIKRKIETLDYPMDGIVIKIKDRQYFESLGHTEHHPKAAVAFKFTNKTRVSHIVDIEISQGKENLSAVAICEPVDFEGVTVTRVKIPMTPPLVNDLPCVSKGEISIGDEIEIERSGDVVPNPVRISKCSRSQEPFILEKCPFCGGELETNETSVKCKNEDCFEKKLRKLDFSIVNIGFVGIGRTNLRKIMKKTGVENISQFMDLTKEKIESTGIGPVNSENIYSEKERCRKNSPDKVLASLNVPSLGNSVAKSLLKKYSIDQISNGLSFSELLNVPGIGEIIAKDLSFHLKSNSDLIKETISKFNFSSEDREYSKGTICFTGKSTRPRSEMESAAKDKGYSPVGRVSKDLTYLVCSDKNSTSSKAQKARQLGISVISEDEFWSI